MTPMSNWSVRVLSLSATLLVCPVLHAQEATEAQLLFERGAELYRARRFGEALEAMVASNRLVPNANVVFNVAQIYELLDRPIDAFNWYQRQLGFAIDTQARTRTEEHVAKLSPRVAVIAVEAEPEHVELFVDRVELGSVGRSPCKVAVIPGEHRLIARLDGYRELNQTVNVASGESVGLKLELQRQLGRLELESLPAGAVVAIEGESATLGTTPLAVELPVGVLKLVLQLEGHIERRVELRIDAAAPARLSVQLSKDPARFASLRVATEPKGTAVRLDERAAGTTPLRLDGLSPGSHKLGLTRENYEPWSVDLQLSAGSATHVQARLLADADKPWPHWHWLGYGAGAALFGAGASVGVVAVVKNNDHAPASSVRHLNHTADALMGTGLVIAAATLIWQLTAKPAPHSNGAVSVRPLGAP